MDNIEQLRIKIEKQCAMQESETFLHQIAGTSDINFIQDNQLPQLPFNPECAVIDISLDGENKLNNSPTFGTSSNKIPSCEDLHESYIQRAKNFKQALRAASTLDLRKEPFLNLVDFIETHPKILQIWGKNCISQNLAFFKNRGAKAHFRKALNMRQLELPPALKASRYHRTEKLDEPLPAPLENLNQISLNGINYDIIPVTVYTPIGDPSAPPQY